MRKVFISYAHDDGEWFAELKEKFEVVIAKINPEVEIFSDAKLKAGERWDKRLREEIHQADLLILLGSADFVTSSYITGTELPLILEKEEGDRLFPVLLTTVGLDYLPELKEIQWMPSEGLASFKGNEAEYDKHLLEVLNELAARVKKLSGLPAGRPSGGPVSAKADYLGEERLAGFENLTGSPYVRITFVGMGNRRFQVDIEARAPGDRAFKTADLKVRFREDPPSIGEITSRVFEDLDFKQVLAPIQAAARQKRMPIRLQIVLHRSVSHLDLVHWEALEWDGIPLGSTASRVFSRQIPFPQADSGELQIKPREQIVFCLIEAEGAGSPKKNTDSYVRWLPPAPLSDSVRRHFTSCWSRIHNPQSDRYELRKALEEAEVIYLRLPIGEEKEDRREDLKLPLPGDTGSQLKEESIEDFIEDLSRLGSNQPTVLILAPRLSPGNDNQVNRELASALALAGVPAVIAPVGKVESRHWNPILERLLKDLKAHGIIDLAVTAARLRAREAGFHIVLYLRSKSARLWYEPHFVTIRGDRRESREVWEKVAEAFETGSKEPDCAVLIGPNLDPTLSLSRREMANEMARKYGFALSKKDRDDLGTVAEYIFTSQASEDDRRPHVKAFLASAEDYLIRRIASKEERDSFQKRQPKPALHEIATRLAKPRLLGENSPFAILAGLNAKCFLTVYYHDVLEMALESTGRRPVSQSFRGSEQRHPEDAADAGEPSLERPVVYHCFGTFGEPQNLLVSESDYLEFLLEYSRSRDYLTQTIRAFLCRSTLFVLGFRPNSQEFKILLAAYRLIEGRRISQKRLHVAVQVDPEDDHTIDPEGAKSFYQGILSNLGDQVHIYWGTPQQFLIDLKDNCRSAFWSKP